MKMTFKNTKTFLEPIDGGLTSIPDGYTLTFPIPPQAGSVALSSKEIKKVQSQGQMAVLGNLLLKMVFSQSMSCYSVQYQLSHAGFPYRGAGQW